MNKFQDIIDDSVYHSEITPENQLFVLERYELPDFKVVDPENELGITEHDLRNGDFLQFLKDYLTTCHVDFNGQYIYDLTIEPTLSFLLLQPEEIKIDINLAQKVICHDLPVDVDHLPVRPLGKTGAIQLGKDTSIHTLAFESTVNYTRPVTEHSFYQMELTKLVQKVTPILETIKMLILFYELEIKGFEYLEVLCEYYQKFSSHGFSLIIAQLATTDDAEPVIRLRDNEAWGKLLKTAYLLHHVPELGCLEERLNTDFYKDHEDILCCYRGDEYELSLYRKIVSSEQLLKTQPQWLWKSADWETDISDKTPASEKTDLIKRLGFDQAMTVKGETHELLEFMMELKNIKRIVLDLDRDNKQVGYMSLPLNNGDLQYLKFSGAETVDNYIARSKVNCLGLISIDSGMVFVLDGKPPYYTEPKISFPLGNELKGTETLAEYPLIEKMFKDMKTPIPLDAMAVYSVNPSEETTVRALIEFETHNIQTTERVVHRSELKIL